MKSSENTMSTHDAEGNNTQQKCNMCDKIDFEIQLLNKHAAKLLDILSVTANEKLAIDLPPTNKLESDLHEKSTLIADLIRLGHNTCDEYLRWTSNGDISVLADLAQRSEQRLDECIARGRELRDYLQFPLRVDIPNEAIVIESGDANEAPMEMNVGTEFSSYDIPRDTKFDHAAWLSFFAPTVSKFTHNTDLRNAVRGGVPVYMRCRYYTKYVESNERFRRDKFALMIAIYTGDPAKFANLVTEIDKDVPRSYPTHPLFSSADTPYCRRMRSVLIAYGVSNPSVGYCQGFSRIVCLLLLIGLEDCVAFGWLEIVLNRMRPTRYYACADGMLDVSVDVTVFVAYMQEFAAECVELFDRADVIDTSVFVFPWFLTMFCDNFHWRFVLPVWDVVLLESDMVLFRFATAVFRALLPLCERIVEQQPHGARDGCVTVLRQVGYLVCRYSAVAKITFCKLHAYPKRRLKQRRIEVRRSLEEEQAAARRRQEASRQKRAAALAAAGKAAAK